MPDLEEARVALGRHSAFEVDAEHDVPTEKVKAAFLPIGESHLELLEPTDPGSVIAKFLEKRSGLHHVVSWSWTTSRRRSPSSRRGGCALIDETPRVGAGGCRVAFIHPKAGGGRAAGAEGTAKALREDEWNSR